MENFIYGFMVNYYLRNMAEKYVKTTLKIREDLFLKAKILAFSREMTLIDVMNNALEKYVKENEEEIKKKLVEVSKE